MLDYAEKRNQIKSLKSELTRAYEGINPAKLRARISELEEIQNGEGFWNDVENAQKVSKEISMAQGKLGKFEKLLGDLDDLLETVDIVELENSEEEDENLVKQISVCAEAVEKLTLSTLLSG